MDSSNPVNNTQPDQSTVAREHNTSQQSSPIKNSNERVISLLNFDANAKTKKFLNSPRSVEAMKRLCFEDYELLVKGEEEFSKEPVPVEFKEEKEFFCKVKADHYEKRRGQKLRLAIQERLAIIQGNDKERTSMDHNNTSKMENTDANMHGSYFNTEYMVQQEKKKIQQMKNQQKKEIDLIISNELRVAEMIKKNEIKQLRMQERDMKRQVEVEIKQKESEEAKQIREEKKIARDREIEEANKIMLEKKKLEEMRRVEVLERIKEEQAADAIRKEKERKSKGVVREKRIGELEVIKRELVEKKREEREERFSRIRQDQDVQQRRKQLQSEQVRRNFEEKIDGVRKRVEVSKEEQRHRVIEKQIAMNEKRERFEEMKRREMDDRRNRSEAKLQEIKKSLDVKYSEEQARKSAYLYKYQQAEENKREREAELERQRKLKIQQEHEKEQRIKEIIQQNDEKLQQKNSVFLQALTQEQIEVERRREQNLKELKKKYINDILKFEDAYENSKRLEKIRDIKKNEYLNKLQTEGERLQHFQTERERAAKEKKKLQDQLEAEKAITLKEFEKQKKVLMHQIGNGDVSVDLKAFSPSIDTSSVVASNTNSNKSPAVFITGQPINGRASEGTNPTNRGSRSVRFSSFNPEKTPAKIEEPKTNVNASRSVIIKDKPQSQAVQLKPIQKPVSSSVKTTPKKIETPARVNKHSLNEISSAQSTKSNNNLKTHNVPLSSKLALKDAVISELQTKEYEAASQDIRKNQHLELLRLLEDATKEDKDLKNSEKNLEKFVGLSQRQEEEIATVRIQNNYLLLA